MNILNWVKRSGWRGLGVMGLMLLGLAAPGLSAAADVDVQIATFTDSPDPATRGGQITYTTVVKNGGPAIATDVVVTWPVPATTTIVSVSDGSGGGTCIHNGATPGVVTCSYASFPVDVTSADWKTVTLVVQTGASTPATVSSSVSVSQTGNTDTNAANDTGTQNTTINNGANLSFAISGAPDPSVGAGNVTWSITGSNLGPNTSGPVTVTVPIPGTLTYVSGAGTDWSCNPAPNANAVCTRAALASGAAYPPLSILTKITSQISGGTLTVGGSIGQTTVADPVPANDTATANVTVNPGLDLQITQDVPSPSSANAGGVAMTFVLRPSNLGPYDATTGANVSFPLPAGFTLTSATGTNGWTCSSAGTPITVTCSLATSMVSGANSALTIVTGTPATVTGSTSYTLTGTVAVNSGGPTDPIPGNNTAARPVTVTPIGLDLSVAKTKTPALVAEGATLTTTITVASTAGGVQAAAGTITVTDVLDPVFETYAGFSGTNWSCSATALPATPQTVTCTYNATLDGGSSASALTITTTAVAAGTATNNASVTYSGTPGDYNPANNGPVPRSTVITAVSNNAPDLIAGLTVSAPGGVATTLETNESTVSYIATLTNDLTAGDDAVDTRMTLTIPAGVTGTSMGTITVALTNTSGASTATYTCTPAAGIINTTSSIVCTQAGGVLKPGDLVTFTVPVSRPLLDGTFTNPPSVTVASTTQGDPVPGNNTATATVIIEPIADIELVSKLITSANPALAGTEVTYVVTIRNNGPSSATGVSMADVFDIPVGDTGFTFVSVSSSSGTCSGLTAGTTYTSVNATPLTCTFGTLANAAALTVTIKIRPNWMPGNPIRTLPNTATVTTTRVENPAGGDNGNNSKTATLTINAAQVDALINNTDVPDPLGYDPAAVAIGTASTNNDVTYDVSITNNGPSLVSGLGFTYTMTAPAGKTITFRGDGAAATVASTTTSGTIAGSICSNVGNSVTGATLTLTCTFAAPGQLASGAAAVHRYLVFRVGTAPATAGDTYTTNATVITNESDSNAFNNSEAELTSVRQRVDLTIAKTPSVTPVQLRQPFNWTITLTNTGPGNSDTTILTDTLPAGMAFFGAAPSFITTGVVKTGTCGVAGQVLTCNISPGSANPFNKDEVATITVPVRMTAYPSGGTTTNCASATTDQVDPATANNTLVCTNLTVQRSSIAGRVFNDPNRNGLFAYTTGATGTDTGMNVIGMVLTGTDAYGNAVNLTQNTAGSAASAGAYLFTNLSPADAAGYTLTETQPATHINGPVDPLAPTLSGTPTAGDQGVYTRGGLAGNSSYTLIKLAANQAGTNYNFPELRRPTLSGQVYADVNANNSYTSGTDTNISGATVVLRNAADLTASVATTTTAANGTYSFTLLDPLLTYVLEEPLPTNPAGLSNQATAVNVGTVNAVPTGTAGPNTPIANTDRITGIDLSAGVDGINYNFGEGGTLATTKVLTSVNGAAAGASVKAGDVLLYTVTTTASNASASTTLCEVTPANTSYTGAVGEGWSAGQGACAAGTTHNQVITVNVGTPVSKTYTVTVASPIADNVTTIDNTVAVTNGTCTTCTVSKPTGAKLAILKTVAAATVNAGQTGNYTLTVSNLGGSATSGLVTFTDTLPAGLSYPTQATTGTLTGMSCSAAGQVVTCSGTPNLGAGATGTLSYTVNVAVSASGTLTNDVKFTTGAIGGDPRTPSCNATTPVAGANSQSTDKLCAKASVTVVIGTLDTTKVLTSVNGAAPGASVKAGDVLLYTVTTTTANASASTSLCEVTPANTSYTGAVGEGWSAGQGACAVGTTHNQVITVNVGTPVSKTYTVTVASPIADNVTSIDNTVAVTNGTCTTCTVSKPTGAKLAILKTVAAATVNAGQTGSYTLTVSNLGGSATSGLVTFTDTLPAGLGYPTQTTTGTLTGMSCSAAGQVVTCSGTPNLGAGATGTLSYTVNVAVSATGTLTNDVKFTTGEIGGDPRTPSCNATTPAAGANSQSTDKLCAKASVNVTASISGVVFNDLNRNGTQDGSEPGIAGVSLKLVAGTDCSAAAFSFAGLANPVMTVVATGAYSFSPVPYGAQYTICETQPGGYADGPVGATTSITIASLTAGGSTGNNFPEVLGSISGKVFADFGSGTAGNNNNGTQEASEPGIGSGTANLGVPVTLTGTPSVGPALPVGGITVFTDATGTYSFADVFPGTYTVTEGVIPLPLGTFNDGINTAGPVTAGGSAGVAGAVGVNTISNIILAAGSQGAGNNFAELPVTSISGVVYLDINENNLIDPIPTDDRIGGATLTLYAGSTCSGSVFGTTTSTPGTGAYSFLNLSAGLTYTVCETQPAGFEEGAVNPGTNAALTAATVNAITVTNLPGSGSANNNFGERVGIDLRVSKTHTPTTFTTDNVGTYTLRVRNVGLQASSGAYTVTDNLPPGMTLASVPAGTGWVCTGLAGATSMACTSSASIAAGVTSADVITVQVNVPAAVAAVPQPVYNVVYVEGGGEPDQKKPTLGEKSGPPTSLPDCDSNITQNICRDPTTIILSASLSGTVWYDVGPQTRVLEAGDRRLPGWTVEVVDATNTVIGSAVTGTNGTYLIDKLPAKVAVSVRFREPLSNVTWGYPVNGEQVPNSPAPCDEAAAVAAGTASSCVVRAPNSQLSVVLQPGTNLAEQSLPVDPSGVVYDSVTRLPVPGSVVTLAPAGLCTGWDPATAIVGAGAGGYTIAGGTISMTVGADGFYQYLFVPGAGAPASCTFTLTVTPPTTHRFVSGMIPPDTGTLSPPGGAAAVYLVQPQALAPTAGVGSGTLYFLSVTAGNTVAGIIHNHIPLDPATLSKLVLTKTGDRRIAEMGDTVVYTLSVRNVAGQALPQVTLRDRLPAGFTLIKGTVKTQNDGGLWVPAADPAGNLGPVLGFNLGALGVNATNTLQYRVRVGVGAMQGTGINVAKAHGCGAAAGCLDPVTLQPLSGTVDSNEARHKVEVTGGVFTDDACLLGKVFVDCNNNHIQDAEELGIPGVRLYLENGQFMVTDSEGKYSRCGITPRSHVLTPDPSTLPRGSVLTTTSNRNLGDANSLFIDLKNGELHRGDFAEGSCTNPVLEQVKARRSQGEVRSVETEKSQAPALRFQSKPLSTPQQGTDSANQPLVQPRQGASDAR